MSNCFREGNTQTFHNASLDVNGIFIDLEPMMIVGANKNVKGSAKTHDTW